MRVVYIPVGLRVLLIVASVLLLAFVIISSRKSKLDVRYAILWISWAIFILVIGIWPELAYSMSRAIGIQSVTNFIFLLMILLLFLLSYYSYIKMSKMNKELKQLNYELAVLKDKEKPEITQPTQEKEKELIH